MTAENAGIVYFVGCFVAFIAATLAFYKGVAVPDGQGHIMGMMMSAFIGLCVCWFWPLLLIILPLYWMFG